MCDRFDDIVIQKKKEEASQSFDPIELMLSKKEEQQLIAAKKLASSSDDDSLSFEPLGELKEKSLKKLSGDDDSDQDYTRLKKKLADDDGFDASIDGAIRLKKKLTEDQSLDDEGDGIVLQKKKLADNDYFDQTDAEVRPVAGWERVLGAAAWVVPGLGPTITIDHAIRDAAVMRANLQREAERQELTMDNVYNY